MQIIRHSDYEGEESPDLGIARNQQGLRQTLEALPGWARAATEQSDEFWRNQRIAIWSRISSAEERSARRIPILAWAVAAAMIAVSGWLLEQPMVAPPREVYVDPDHELLMEVERMVQIDGPLALEPAALLAQEMVQDLPARNYPVRKKEPRNEN
jgi:hypothetical protein